MNCPFYGRSMYRNNSLIVDPPFLLLAQQGNQCGLVTTSHAPCVMEVVNEEPDWKACSLVKQARMEEID